MTIRVLVVDDSLTMRALIADLLDSEPDISVIGGAGDAAEARAMIRALDPDVVTLDIEMPGMSGLDFLDRLMRLRPTPVIIVSGATRDSAEISGRALAMGAAGCYAKPTGQSGTLLSADGGRLAALIRAAAAGVPPRRAPPALIAIGASTGGIEALQIMLQGFPADCPPTLVVQHINGRFAAGLARRLDRRCAPTVTLAEPHLPLRAGHVYLAPGNERHLTLRRTDSLHTRAWPGPKTAGHRPSVDVLFASVAEVLGDKAVGILLSGMGQDGARGLLAMAGAGALTIVQDEASCAVFGMPRAAIRLGAAQVVAPIERIADHAFARAG